jgi:arsenate reductase (glutaredoxin)
MMNCSLQRLPTRVGQPTIVCAVRGVKLCLPSETVFDLLDRLPLGPFYKEDGGLLVDAEGRRVA